MSMKGFMFVVLNLAFSSGLYISTNEPDVEEVIINNSTEPSKDAFYDDIRELPFQRSSIIDESELWTFPVPYVFDENLDLNAKGVMLRAFDQFRLKSCIDFKPRDFEEYYLKVQKLTGCFSYIGKVIRNGQDLSIGSNCDYLYIAEHEILHALGFFHEQSRYDRDDYVRIVNENILEGRERNFNKVEDSSTQGVPYDYWSVMHYGKDAFTNGNGSTIITIDPKFQDVIGQDLEMSTRDVQELNLLYKCNSTIAFDMHCSFSNGTMCQMNRCSRGGNGWDMVTQVYGGPDSDHTTLPGGNTDHGQESGYFMHASTASGQEGDSASLETRMMSPKRDCHVQCLQFYYYHSGNDSDTLNIWIREFQDEQDSTGTLRLMGQITGPQTSHWKLQHVSLNATKNFQVVFEVRKGAGNSPGGFSIDDINLSETECPHVTVQIDEFEKLLNTTDFRTRVYSPRQYSKDGYAYRVAVTIYQTFFGLNFQLVSGDYDDQLKWPCLQRQITSQMLDQNPNIKLQMSKQRSITTELGHVTSDGDVVWDNPRETGVPIVDENNQTIYVGPLYGYYFANVDEMETREFLKGGTAIFTFNFQDLTPLVYGNVLPCAQVASVNIPHPPAEGPCSTRISPTTAGPSTTDDSIFGSSPVMVPSAVLTVLLTVMLMIP
ncbi:meprin A subunit beta-like [Cololabis saira]|uniref:meprin A subunit beta-like n=1 Tax=Cololabis saira TaxID=129043 RepID=UPI002AD3D3CC|nr:meprin A subunit beta-like [Cololabis saira]XP_061573198.1 meprin A subunit beta-like [Cololabis saira]